MDLGIAGRKAIVCASSRGLGRGCAVALAEAGCDIVINGRDGAALDEAARDIGSRYGVTVTPVVGDVGQPDVQRLLFAACPEPDILVNNNAGPPRREFEELDRDKIVAGLIQNMVTPLELIQGALAGMKARRFGRIVNITSFSVKMPIPGLDLSSGARAGLTAFLAGVCRLVADRNVTINNLLPGRMDTARLQSGFGREVELTGEPIEVVTAEAAKGVPAGRFGTPEEFGQVCAFLCSVHASYITGQNILVDGGLFPGAF
jgi:3-oxoacyl-[acyl-carrier protein] reductase